MQVELDRRVALKVFEPGSALGSRLPALRWPEHPNVVHLYAAGTSDAGAFIALQLVRGPTLERLLDGRRIGRRTMRSLLSDVGSALDSAHLAGHVHGAVSARNVFADDGCALLSDFGLGDVDATPATDRAAFADLVRKCGGRLPTAPTFPTAREMAATAFPRRRRRFVIAAVGAVAAIVATAAVVLVRGSGGAETVPGLLPGAAALGSTLPSGGTESVDCSARTTSGASEACTVAQTTLRGRAVSANRAGVIRRWAVRGARGQVALEVLRRRGRTFFMVARTPYVAIRDEGVRVLNANLPVEPGDLVGLAVTPGAAVGIRRIGGAQTDRWFGPLIYTVRAPEKGPGTGFDHELLLRVEYVPGASWQLPGRLAGAAAASAPPGQVAGRYTLRRGANPAALVVTRIGGGVAADLMVGGRRLVRLPLESARREGVLEEIEYEAVRFDRQILRVRWQNPHTTVAHEYAVNERSLTLLS